MIFKLLKLLSGKTNAPTQRQLEYLGDLVEKNNEFRAKPRSLEDWIDQIYKGEFDIFRAGKLIEILKRENNEKKEQFKENLEENQVKAQRSIISVSEISAFVFCPNSYILKSKNKTNKNLYELEVGKFYHGELASEDSGFSNQNSSFIKEKLIGVKEVMWFKLEESEMLIDEENNLGGRVDGLIQYQDDRLAVVELKSKNNLENLKEPFWGDKLQACGYHYLFLRGSGQNKMREECYVLYIDKSTQRRKLFDIKYVDYEGALLSSLNKIKNIKYDKALYMSEKYEKRCKTCGFRNYCSRSKID